MNDSLSLDNLSLNAGSIKDIAAQRFGSWTAIRLVARPADKTVKEAYWLCRCECGAQGVQTGRRLRYGNVKMCAACSSAPNYRYNPLTASTYQSWRAMRLRCLNPKQAGYKRYGGRGITICDRWNNFANFLEDMGLRPEGKTLDRTDSNGNYTPENCRWATELEQQRNRANSKITDEQAAEIKRLASAGHRTKDIAARYGLCTGYVRAVVRGIRRGGVSRARERRRSW